MNRQIIVVLVLKLDLLAARGTVKFLTILKFFPCLVICYSEVMCIDWQGSIWLAAWRQDSAVHASLAQAGRERDDNRKMLEYISSMHQISKNKLAAIPSMLSKHSAVT